MGHTLKGHRPQHIDRGCLGEQSKLPESDNSRRLSKPLANWRIVSCEICVSLPHKDRLLRRAPSVCKSNVARWGATIHLLRFNSSAATHCRAVAFNLSSRVGLKGGKTTPSKQMVLIRGKCIWYISALLGKPCVLVLGRCTSSSNGHARLMLAAISSTLSMPASISAASAGTQYPAVSRCRSGDAQHISTRAFGDIAQ